MATNPQTKLHAIADFLADPFISSLILTHPNRLPEPAFAVPRQWRDWWDASPASLDWFSLLTYSARVQSSSHDRSRNLAEEGDGDGIPLSLRWAVEAARRLQIPRDPVISVDGSHKPCPPERQGPGAYGMSPKKNHEVTQMITYIRGLLSSLPGVHHVVDVGSGQGYLSRALRDTLHLHVLAIDGDGAQTQGAERRAAKVQKGKAHEHAGAGSLTHKTVRITPDTLKSAVDEWTAGQGAVPVLVVALHACGSLTPDIVRCCLAQRRENWTLAGAVLVGCCYNLMSESDFPLSRSLAESATRPSLKLYRRYSSVPSDCDPPPYTEDSSRPCTLHDLVLTEHHVQLAAQVPSQWTRTEEALRAAELAMNKVVWRALLGRWVGLVEGRDSIGLRRALASDHDETSRAREGAGVKPPSDTAEPRARVRLGKLGKAAYADWATFLRVASERTGVAFPGAASRDPDLALRRRLEVVYVMRCLLGPVVESLVLLDRMVWVQEGLGGGGMEVGLVNLFDQGTGSGRNVAIVIAPREVAAGDVEGAGHPSAIGGR